MRTCPTCGDPQPGDRCARCAAEETTDGWRVGFIRRETVLLLVLVVIAVAAFTFTRRVAQRNRDIRLGDAARWHQLATRELDAGRPDEASTALRRAVVADPESRLYQLDLARALAAADQDDRARQVLLRLRDRQPEDAEVNLELARLEARGGSEAAAVRYYQHALASLWSDESTETSQRVRTEMIEFLLRQGQRRRALAELLVLSPTLPDEVPARTKAGRMFLDVGDARRARDQFAAALAIDGSDGQALAGAGEAAFEMGDYVRAREYLARAPDSVDRVGELRVIVESVLTRDPLAPRIGTSERRRRHIANLDDVSRELTACIDGPRAAPSLEPLRAELEALRSTVGARPGMVDRDVAEEGLDRLVQIVQAAGKVCGPPSPLDRALLLIARRYSIETS